MENKESFSFEEKFRKLEQDPERQRSIKEKKRMQELAGIDSRQMPESFKEFLGKFSSLLNKAANEIKRNRGTE